jgi:hypothetical protein
MFAEPFGVSFRKQRKVVKLAAQFTAQIPAFAERMESGGRELVLLKFGKQCAQFLRESGSPRAAAKKFEFAFMLHQQGAQHHDAAFVGQKFRRRDAELFQNESREPVEGKNVQSREAGNFAAGEQLTFELKCRLFGREQNQRRAVGIFPQRGADFLQTAERLAAAGGAEEKSRLHRRIFRPKTLWRKAIYLQFVTNSDWSRAAIFVSFGQRRVIIPGVWENGFA